MARILYTTSNDPYHNLALESHLLDTLQGDVVLYLWQNDQTVVIGRSQNAWSECDTAAMERDGVRLARRPSGGGAVYHDMGNLNFTFVAPPGVYDVQRQLGVILSALHTLGIAASMSGRNDLTAGERKFSGNAFMHRKHASLHHGTLLVHSDISRMTKYLTPSQPKLQAKGIASVSSRVVNLRELSPTLDVPTLHEALVSAFAKEYGAAAHASLFEDEALLSPIITSLSRWSWNYGEAPAFDVKWDMRFPFGTFSFFLQLQKGLIAHARVYSDALDTDLVDALQAIWDGCPFSSMACAARLERLPDAYHEAREALCAYFAEHPF